MAIYSTFFLAKPTQLLAAFRGWKPALPAPVCRQFRNPFTKQLVETFTREPEWSEEDSPFNPQEYRVAEIRGSYPDFLDSRLPQFVRDNPHWAAKGLSSIELEPLLTIIGVNPNLESPIYAPPSSAATLHESPPQWVPTLMQIDPREISKQWAAELSTPEHTHAATGAKLSDGWTTDQASQILNAIVSLAQTAASDQRMYLLIEA